MPSEDADGPSAVPYSIAGGKDAQSAPPLLSALSALSALAALAALPALPATRGPAPGRRSAER